MRELILWAIAVFLFLIAIGAGFGALLGNWSQRKRAWHPGLTPHKWAL